MRIIENVAIQHIQYSSDQGLCNATNATYTLNGVQSCARFHHWCNLQEVKIALSNLKYVRDGSKQ